MIRVLHVFHGMNCGGAETMIMNLYRHIDKSKVQFDFLVHSSKKCHYDDEIKSLGGNIYYVPYYKVINEIAYRKALNQFFLEHPEIKIVHGHLGSCAHIYLSIAKRYGCFTIAHSHSTKPKEISVKNVLYRLFTFVTRHTAEYFFGCSMAAAEYRYGKKIANSKNCSILKNAIDVDSFAFSEKNRNEIRRELNVDEKFVIGHVGRFDPAKNHDFLLDVFKKIHDEKPDSVLVLVGDGSLRSKIESKIKSLCIEGSVICTGVRSDVNRLLSAFDVFLFPSLYEGLPVTVIEAQAAGLQCIISSTITTEVCISSLVKQLSLFQPKSDWVNCVAECKRDKVDVRNEIRNAGYDIEQTSAELCQFYLQKLNCKN